MSRKSKVGRGALVRRLRREYGITEQDARIAAEGGAWGVDSPDTTAAAMRDRRRSINRGQPGPRTLWLDSCPRRPAGWCEPLGGDRPDQPPGPRSASGMRTPRLLALAAALGAV
jgi:hypothetical protein